MRGGYHPSLISPNHQNHPCRLQPSYSACAVPVVFAGSVYHADWCLQSQFSWGGFYSRPNTCPPVLCSGATKENKPWSIPLATPDQASLRYPTAHRSATNNESNYRNHWSRRYRERNRSRAWQSPDLTQTNIAECRKGALQARRGWIPWVSGRRRRPRLIAR